MTILDCGHPPTATDGCGTGYGTLPDGTRHCYECCALFESGRMIAEGKTTLYLCGNRTTGFTLTDWAGYLKFPVRSMRKGRHNWGIPRYDVWFTGPDKRTWHGVQYGDNTQLCHCKRNKS